jgi:hypothetical protein
VSTVSIRRAGADDAEPLAAVYRSAYRENRRLGCPAKAESATPETVGEWIAEHEVHVATVDAEVVGGVRLEEVAPERVKLGRPAVRADCKGDGIGSRLLTRSSWRSGSCRRRRVRTGHRTLPSTDRSAASRGLGPESAPGPAASESYKPPGRLPPLAAMMRLEPPLRAPCDDAHS